MRFAYLDEAGIGHPSKDPHIVVAGIVLDADNQWRKLERHLHNLAYELWPEGEPTAPFHAADLWHGTKRFHRHRWPRDLRMKILHELASIPAQFKMPVLMGFIRRADVEERMSDVTPHMRAALGQMVAFVSAAAAIESFMRDPAVGLAEVATIVCEDNGNARRMVRGMHNLLRSPASSELKGDVAQYLPLQRIIETVHFAEKGDSSPLQVADVCAFLIKRPLQGSADSDPLFQLLTPQMSKRPIPDLGSAPLRA